MQVLWMVRRRRSYGVAEGSLIQARDEIRHKNREIKRLTAVVAMLEGEIQKQRLSGPNQRSRRSTKS